MPPRRAMSTTAAKLARSRGQKAPGQSCCAAGAGGRRHRQRRLCRGARRSFPIGEGRVHRTDACRCSMPGRPRAPATSNPPMPIWHRWRRRAAPRRSPQFHRALIHDLAGDKRRCGKSVLAARCRRRAQVRASPKPLAAFSSARAAGRCAHVLYQARRRSRRCSPWLRRAWRVSRADEKPDRLVSSPAEGAAEALFGIAASLSDQNSADVAVFYLRLALFLGPIWTSPKSCSPTASKSLGKYEDAIAIYKSLGDKSVLSCRRGGADRARRSEAREERRGHRRT